MEVRRQAPGARRLLQVLHLVGDNVAVDGSQHLLTTPYKSRTRPWAAKRAVSARLRGSDATGRSVGTRAENASRAKDGSKLVEYVWR